jgi:hypothetical protein
MSSTAALQMITQLVQETIEFISNFFKKTIKFSGNLIGIKCIEERIDYNQLLTAGWIFIIGMPIGLIIFGSQFSIPVWLFIITIGLILYNIEHIIKEILIKEIKPCSNQYLYT